MRDIFQTTITQVQADGTVKALSGIEISVYLPGGTQLATIYQRRTGVAQGPAPETGASGGPNPFTTGATGGVEFWLPAGLYEIWVRDTNAPARIAARGGAGNAPPIEWNAAPMSAGSVPTSVLALDGGIKLGHVNGELLRQDIPIGGVIDWWRPNSTVAAPAGFEICDGHQVTTHDFIGVSGAINTPNLVNKFVIGADITKADGSGSNAGDASGDAPGIRGTGGSNAPHKHPVPAHYHGRGDLAVSWTNTDHTHAGTTAGMNSNASHGHSLAGGSAWFRGVVKPDIWGERQQGDSGSYRSPTYGAGAATADITGTDGTNIDHSHNFGTGGMSANASHGHGLTGSIGATGGSNGDAAFDSNTTDGRPAHIGLLKIIKVRRS